MRCQRIAGTVIFPLGKTQHGFDQDGNIPYRFCRQTAFPIQSAILFDTQQERGKLFRRQARNSDMAEMRKDVPLKQKVIAGARGDFNIGLRQILREKLFYRQAAGTDRLLWQRLYRSDQLLFYNGSVPPIDRPILCLSIRQTHGDIAPLPAAVFSAIDIISPSSQALSTFQLYHIFDGKCEASRAATTRSWFTYFRFLSFTEL